MSFLAHTHSSPQSTIKYYSRRLHQTFNKHPTTIITQNRNFGGVKPHKRTTKKTASATDDTPKKSGTNTNINITTTNTKNKKLLANQKQQNSAAKTDKTTQEFQEILNWWRLTKQNRLDLTNTPNKSAEQFLAARTNYKLQELERLSTIRDTINHAIERRQQALNALPARLAFAAQIQSKPEWRTQLAQHISLTSDKLHLLNYNQAEHDPTSQRLMIDPRTGLPSKLNEQLMAEIAGIVSGSGSGTAKDSKSKAEVYSQPVSVLDDFPPMYDPSDIRTQPAYVRSLFDYQWEEGMVAPIRVKVSSLDPNQSVLDDTERQVYGQDMTGLRFGTVTRSGNTGTSIGGALELKRQLMDSQNENQKNLNSKQKKILREQQKNAQLRGTKDYRQMQEKKAEKRKMNKDLRSWHYNLKHTKSELQKFDEFDEDDQDSEFGLGGEELDENARKLRAQRRIKELEIINSELPKLEQLLVDKPLNKTFFEKTLPLIINHPMTDDRKKNECVLLLKKFQLLQTHVGYGVR